MAKKDSRLLGWLSWVIPVLGLSQIMVFQAHSELAAPKDRAARIYQRLAGVPLALKDARLSQMEVLVSQGKLLEAAAIATNDHYFYDLTLKHWAAQLSTKDETPYAEFNDFQAMIIGATRDDMDARQLLTGNFTYQAKGVAGVPAVSLTSNSHYQNLDTKRIDLKASLSKVEPQREDIQDAAGLLTSRGWAEAHYQGGTNRRAVEYTFREFLCAPITQWQDIGLPDYHIRRDVDRAPGGNPETFQTQCRNCHAPMDGMAGAFSQVDFQNNQLQYLGPTGVAAKYNQNGTVYPEGYVTIQGDNSWINYATLNHNRGLGWRGSTEGRGIKAFGEMIANSEAFKTCMVKRVFKEVCKRETTAQEKDLVATLASGFEANKYRLKRLFEETAVNPACLGE